MTRSIGIYKFFALIFISLFLTNCTSTNHTKTDKKILDYESSGNVLNALSLGVPGAAILFLTVDINNYKKFNLNNSYLKNLVIKQGWRYLFFYKDKNCLNLKSSQNMC